MKRWMVYFRNSDGCREGTEPIDAPNRKEAIRIYRLFFNVPLEVPCRAIPVFDAKDFNKSQNL